VKLHPIDAEGAPSHPGRALKDCKLRNLPGVHRREQSRIYEQGFGLSYQLRYDGPPQGFEESPKLADATVERGRGEAKHPREEVGEEAGGFAQEGAAGLDTPKLLEQREGDDLRVRESLEGFVETAIRIEVPVGVVDLAEQDGDRLFQELGLWGILCLGHPMLLWSGLWMALVLSHHPRNTHLVSAGQCPGILFTQSPRRVLLGNSSPSRQVPNVSERYVLANIRIFRTQGFSEVSGRHFDRQYGSDRPIRKRVRKLPSMDERVLASAVWREAYVLIRKHLVAAFLPAAIIGTLVEAPYLLPDSKYVIQDILAFLTEAFAFYLYVAYVEQVIVEAQSAEHIPLGGVLRPLLLAAPFVPLVLAGSVAAIALPTAAASLLVIPGLWLLTRWSLFAPVIVREGLGPVAALRRSSELVRGHFEVVFLTAAFGVILEEAVADGGALVGLVVSGSETWGEWVGGTVALVLIMLLTSFATTLAYGLLCRLSETN
jgi:hypothetical protein